MKQRNWAKYIWGVLTVLWTLETLADMIGGQDPYRHQVLTMLALILCCACDTKERLG